MLLENERLGKNRMAHLIKKQCITDCSHIKILLIKNGPFPASVYLFLVMFKQTLKLLQQYNVKNVPPVLGFKLMTS